MIKQQKGKSLFLAPHNAPTPAHLPGFMKSSRSAYVSKRFTSVASASTSRNTQMTRRQDVFAEGQWQMLKAMLERQGWSQSQLEIMREQLRQGWPLSIAKQNVAAIIGHCPISSRPMA